MALISGLIIVDIIGIAICYWVARKKKANTVFWVGMGVLLGPLAIPFVFFSTPKSHE